MAASPTTALVDEVAAELGVTVVRAFDRGLFGASLVERSDGAQQVLKVEPDRALASVWATGAATAEVLRSGGYPASRYVGTGEVADGVWSLQEVLPGEVPLRLDGPLAVQLVELAGCHATDAGARRDWKADAREAAEGWIDTLSDDGVAPGFLDVMASTLEATTAAELLETTVVHGDFHHGNCTTIGSGVAGVFDWEIAGPGDWRFDLVHLHFWTQVLPPIADTEGAEVVTRAVRDAVPDDVAAFMWACQSLRCVSLERARRPDRVGRLTERILRCFDW